MARKTLYLANPYGFSEQQRGRLLPELVERLESLGAEVWEPFARNNQSGMDEAGWAWRVAQADARDVREADGLFAVVNGTPPDEGVMVELGLAIALEKPTFLFRDDFRRCTDSEDYPPQPHALRGAARARLAGALLHPPRRAGGAREGARSLVVGRLTGACGGLGARPFRAPRSRAA